MRVTFLPTNAITYQETNFYVQNFKIILSIKYKGLKYFLS